MGLSEQNLEGLVRAQRIGRRSRLLHKARGPRGSSTQWLVFWALVVFVVMGVMEGDGLGIEAIAVFGGALFGVIYQLSRRCDALTTLAEDLAAEQPAGAGEASQGEGASPPS
jgi:hypothetical protein